MSRVLLVSRTLRVCRRALFFFVWTGCLVLAETAGAQADFGRLDSGWVDSGRTALDTRASAVPAGAVDMGPLPASQPLTLTLTFAQTEARRAALDQFLDEVTKPGSPRYHQWLTPAEFAASYGAPAEEITEAIAWAQAQGLSVLSLSPAKTRIRVTGFAAQIESAFAVPLHAFRVQRADGWEDAFAPVGEPSLPAGAAALFLGVDGLDELRADRSLTLAGAATSFAALGGWVDANAFPLLELNSGSCTASVSPMVVAEYTQLFRQATAQGVTILSAHRCAAGGFPDGLAEVTGVALMGGAAETPLRVRPAWQTAPGLPPDAMRHGPDLEAASLPALTAVLTVLAGSEPGSRLGNLNAVLYELGPTPGLYTQPDAAEAGTWEAATGLGMVDLQKLLKSWPHGTGTSFTSFGASNYSPVHGQPSTFTSSVTSGTGGATPTGTVSFVTSTGTTLGTANLVNGTATYTETTLDGGSYTVQANYSGDGTYAASSSGTGGLFVQPEPSQLTATVSSNNTIGTNFAVMVTDAASSGIGTPSGVVTVTVYGQTTQTATNTLSSSGTGVATTTVSVPTIQVGTLSLTINCTSSPSYSCSNAINKTVVIGKATPALKFSYAPTTLVAGQTVTLTASVAGVGTAPTPTGNVEFYDGTTVLNAGTLQNGSTTVTGVLPTTATHSITAVYQGDPDYNMVNSATAATSSTAVLSATISSLTGVAGMSDPITASVTVTGGGTPAGAINVSDGTQVLASGSLSATGANAASVTLNPALPATAGSYTLTVSCASTDSFVCGNAVSFQVTVTSSPTGTIPTATSLTLTPAAPAVGAGVVLTATVTTPSSTTAIAGTVMFYSGSTLLGTGTIANGMATFTTTVSSAAEVFTATYAGNATYAASTSPAVSVTSALIPTTTTLSSSSSQSQAGAGVTLTAKVQESSPGSSAGAAASASPTGTVTFYAAGSVPQALGTGNVAQSGAGLGTATLTTTAIPAGNETLYAVYSGDTVFAMSTSSSVAIGLSDYAIAFTPPTSTLTPGETGTVQMAVTTSGSFSGHILIGCTPPANVNLTCSVAGGSLTGSGAAVLSIQTFNAAVARNGQVSPQSGVGNDWRAIGGVNLATLLCFLLPGRKKRRLPAMLLVLLAIGLLANVGCSTMNSNGGTVQGGTPLGTYVVTVNSSANNGVTSVTHDYSYQVTIQ